MSLRPSKRSSRPPLSDLVDEVKLKKPRQRSTQVEPLPSRSPSSSSTSPESPPPLQRTPHPPSPSPRYPRRSTAYRGSYAREFPCLESPTVAAQDSNHPVEKIIAHHATELGTLFLVKRKGRKSSEAAWEPIESLNDSGDLLDEYLAKINPPRLSSTASEYQVEKILRHRKTRSGLEFEVKWVGYPQSGNTWEPKRHLDKCTTLREYLKKMKRK